MRTTLDIADDVLHAAKERAGREHKTTGEVISDLARSALTARRDTAAAPPKAVHGFRPFPRRGGIVTNRSINALRENDAY